MFDLFKRKFDLHGGAVKCEIFRVGATCVACDAVAKKVRRSATATEQFSKVRRKIVKKLKFCLIICPVCPCVFRRK